MEFPDVLSFDSSRVTAVSHKGVMVVEKRTTKQEYFQLKLAERHLAEYPILIGSSKIRVAVPDIIKWDMGRQILITSFCHGSNVEELLKNCSNLVRKQVLAVLREFVVLLKESGFLWGDVAPRNIVICSSDNTLRIFDFERKLEIAPRPVPQGHFARFLRNYGYEELSCFLLEDEMVQVFDGLLDDDDGMICASRIVSKRRKRLLANLCGVKDWYLVSEVRAAEDLMSKVAIPFFINGTVFYPMQIIDKISSKGGPDAYVSIVCQLKNLSQRERYELLIQMAQFL